MVAIIAILTVALAPNQSDGLDFIRRYGQKNEKLVEQKNGMPGLISVWLREFEFDQIPAELIGDIWKGAKPTKSTDFDAYSVMKRDKNWFSISGQTIQVELHDDPSWLTKQWEAMKDWFRPTSP